LTAASCVGDFDLVGVIVVAEAGADLQPVLAVIAAMRLMITHGSP